MIVTQSKIYLLPGTAKTIRFPMRNMLYLRAVCTGTIIASSLRLSSPLGSLELGGINAEAVFNVRLNGSALCSDPDKPTIDLGEMTVEKSGLSVSVSKYDVMVLDLESIVGRAGRSITWMIEIDKN